MNRYYSLIILALALLTSYQPASAQWDGDKVETEKGVLHIKPIMHGTLAMQWQGKTIYVDPYGGAENFKGLPDPDIILITDIHGDHLDLKTLDTLNTEKAVLVVPQAVADKLPETYKSRLQIMNNGDMKELEGIQIEAIPMYNLPEDSTSRHTKGRGNGYLLSMGGKRIYLSGDTEDIGEMRSLQNIDVAFVCMNLPYTMDIYQATSAVLEFKPRVVYPYHYRGKNGLSDVMAFKLLIQSETSDVDVRLRNWYPERKE